MLLPPLPSPGPSLLLPPTATAPHCYCPPPLLPSLLLLAPLLLPPPPCCYCHLLLTMWYMSPQHQRRLEYWLAG